MLADRVEDDVVRLPVLREVLVQVVDDLVGAERAHELDVLRVADRRDVCAEVGGELHRCRSARARRSVDKDPRSRADTSALEPGQPLAHPVADGRRLLEGRVRRHVREHAGFPDTDVLGVRAVSQAEHPVSHCELRDCVTHRLDHAGELEAQDPPSGSSQPEHEPPEERARTAHVAVRLRDRRGVDANENLVVLGSRSLDLLESQDGRRPVPVVDNRSHDFASPLPFSVSTTFPVFCPVSTYLVASTTSSSG